MKEILKRSIIKYLPKGITLEITKPYREQQVYYSQEGEDILLERLFNYKQDGLYIDVGAHHPIRFSNTYKFYQRGWRGINIDAMPGSMDLFNSMRPHDINIEIGVSSEKSKIPFYIFEEKALNTFDEALALERSIKCGTPTKVEVKTLPLSLILDNYLPPNKHIDFMSIDVEGLDLDVLESNNWTKYVPTIIVVECLSNELDEILKSKVNYFLVSKGYTIFAKIYNSVIYKRINNV